MINTFSPQVVEMAELNNLFIELTSKNCNQRCKHCYIDFPISKNVKDFISIDRIKDALNDTKNENIEFIYLTGAEPMTHPEFNNILRLCLKKANVCICTNATFINEKKARFLKKVEDESTNEIVFKLSIDHYNEIKNDDLRGRGAYRQTLNAIKSLAKYNFNPILNIVNYYNEDEDVLRSEFNKICEKIGFEATDFNFHINKYHNKYKPVSDDFRINETGDFDCKNGRILTEKGIYVCPFLANDHRGRMGNDFKDFSKKMYLETDFCLTCSQNRNKMFGINLTLLHKA
ncbi:MAG: radical SAM protein [Candidatus Gastranaerophilales bacterium]|nr:radical SAM protein [Candidatus Gastranaerophilales bacterium]